MVPWIPDSVNFLEAAVTNDLGSCLQHFQEQAGAIRDSVTAFPPVTAMTQYSLRYLMLAYLAWCFILAPGYEWSGFPDW